MKSMLKLATVFLSIVMVQGTLAAGTLDERTGHELTCYGGKAACGYKCVGVFPMRSVEGLLTN